jgi:integrase
MFWQSARAKSARFENCFGAKFTAFEDLSADLERKIKPKERRRAGVRIEDGQRFGLHNLRRSLSNWLVNKTKVEPKTVQGILRHARVQTTLDLYTQQDGDETLAAQGEYLTALGVATPLLQ